MTGQVLGEPYRTPAQLFAQLEVDLSFVLARAGATHEEAYSAREFILLPDIPIAVPEMTLSGLAAVSRTRTALYERLHAPEDGFGVDEGIVLDHVFPSTGLPKTLLQAAEHLAAVRHQEDRTSSNHYIGAFISGVGKFARRLEPGYDISLPGRAAPRRSRLSTPDSRVTQQTIREPIRGFRSRR